ncbi:MFS transporter [Helicobacter sp. 11S02629-2]|uniref:MFS transporter n=1 Tax=Helicobacter sp. 11S02629-2 TaxID=1476195 RepID=UPI000BCD76AA|nr:MFS transporter [Helicobacter sp. 11S02629-2]PAF44596.1 hypothetical protein BKH40_05020 [Helicobacter sp. 11S02629-2]
MKAKIKPTSILLILIVLISLNLRAPVTGVGPLMGDITDVLHSSTLAGLLAGIVLALFGFGSLVALKFNYIKMIFLAIICCFVGLIIRSYGLDIFAGFGNFGIYLFIGTFLVGLGIAVQNVLVPVLIKKFFAKRLGFMTGLYGAALCISAFLGASISLPISHVLDFKAALAIWAILSLIVLLAWIPMLKHGRWRAKFVLKKKKSTVNLYANFEVWVIVLFMGLQSLLFYTFAAWYPLILQSKGVSLSTSANINSLMQFFAIFSAFLVPRLTARVRPPARKIIVMLVALCYLVAGIMLFIPSSSFTLDVIMTFIVSIPIGGGFSLGLLFIALNAKDVPTSLFLSGFAQFGGYLIAATGPFIVGILKDLSHSFVPGIIFICICSVVLTLLGLRITKIKRI